MGDNFDSSAFTKEELSLLIKSQADDLVARLFNSTDVEAPLAREWLETTIINRGRSTRWTNFI